SAGIAELEPLGAPGSARYAHDFSAPGAGFVLRSVLGRATGVEREHRRDPRRDGYASADHLPPLARCSDAMRAPKLGAGPAGGGAARVAFTASSDRSGTLGRA